MPDKVAFATTNWKDIPLAMPSGEPVWTQPEWDAYHSSKFNGFPFPVYEINEDKQPLSTWDKETYYDSKPSARTDKAVSVLTDEYSYKFTFDQLIQVFWRMSHAKPRIEGVSESTSGRNYRQSSYAYNISQGSLSANPSQIPKEKESELVTKTNENFWRIRIAPNSTNSDYESCTVGIDFRKPVFKTGENEYRPYVFCDCCNRCSNYYPWPQATYNVSFSVAFPEGAAGTNGLGVPIDQVLGGTYTAFAIRFVPDSTPPHQCYTPTSLGPGTNFFKKGGCQQDNPYLEIPVSFVGSCFGINWPGSYRWWEVSGEGWWLGSDFGASHRIFGPGTHTFEEEWALYPPWWDGNPATPIEFPAIITVTVS